MGFSNVIIELDALVLTSFMNSFLKCLHPSLSLIVHDCRSLLQAIPHTGVKHVFKETDKCAKYLTTLGRACIERSLSFFFW